MLRFLCLTGLILLVSLPRAARACAAADDLARLHSDYAALLSGRPAAAVATPPIDTLDLVRRATQEGAAIDASDMARVAADLALLAETAQSGDAGEISASALARHVRNLETVQGWVRATGCETGIVPLPAADRPTAAQPSTDRAPGGGAAASPSPALDLAVFMLFLLGLGGAGLAAYLCRSHLYEALGLAGRRRERRVPVSIDVILTIEGDDTATPARAVDLSRGGAKLATGSELPARARLTLAMGDTTLTATVAWSNSYYAGVAFSPPLDEETFQRLRTL